MFGYPIVLRLSGSRKAETVGMHGKLLKQLNTSLHARTPR
jgi:hypothetical protein